MKTTEIFKIRPTNEKNDDFIITIGNHLASEKHFKTKEEAWEYIKYPKWETIFALVAEMIEFSKTKELKVKTEEIEQENKIENDGNN